MEHLEHFGLSRDPFCNDPQVATYFQGSEHAQVEKRLVRAVGQRKGLVLCTGPRGAGKSMIVRHLLDSLEEEVYEACLLLPTPGVADGHWVLARLAAQLGVEEPAEDRAGLLGQVYDAMAIVREDGRHTVLFVDETEVLAERGALGALQALLNLEYEERRLLTLVLVGVPEVAEAIAHERGLADRVDVHVRLHALDAGGAEEYLVHRIRRVGGSPAILDPNAVPVLIDRSGGVPRRLNTIADNALFEAFLAGRVSARAADVNKAADDLQLDVSPSPTGAVAPPPRPAAAAEDEPTQPPARSRAQAEETMQLADSDDAASIFSADGAGSVDAPGMPEATTVLSSEIPAPPRGMPDATMILSSNDGDDGLGGFGEPIPEPPVRATARRRKRRSRTCSSISSRIPETRRRSARVGGLGRVR